MVKFWPETPIGRMILLVKLPDHPDDVLPDSEQDRLLRNLEGHDGIAKSAMLPSGSIEVDGHLFDAVSRGEAIDAGEPIRVVEVEGKFCDRSAIGRRLLC